MMMVVVILLLIGGIGRKAVTEKSARLMNRSSTYMVKSQTVVRSAVPAWWHWQTGEKKKRVVPPSARAGMPILSD